MNITNLKNLNNYSIAKELFNNISSYKLNNNTTHNLECFIGEIEKVLDKVQDKENHYKLGYEKGYSDGYSDREEVTYSKT